MLITGIAAAAPSAAAIGAAILWRRERAAHRRARAQAAAQAESMHTREAAAQRLAEGWLPALVRGWSEPFDPTPDDVLVGTAFAAALDAIVASARALARGRAEEQQKAAGWYDRAASATRQLRELEEAQRSQAVADQLPAWTEALLLLARRAHPLVDQAVVGLSEAERGVEDPELLDLLFGVDHRAVLLRRLIENAALLAGQVPRGLARSTALATVLRTGSAEIHAFRQVQHVPPSQELYLPGHVAWALTRIVAELSDNATRFSPPGSRAVVNAAMVPEGVLVTVQDRGLSLPGAHLEWLNGVLAWPEGPSAIQQLRSGQLGLLVSARLARSHGLTISLEAAAPGVRASVFVPGRYLTTEAPPALPDADYLPTAAVGPQVQPYVASAVQPAPGRTSSGAPPLPRRVRPSVPLATARPERVPAAQETQPPSASTALAASWLAGTRQADLLTTTTEPSQS
ncbi:ATP-binding protein [Kitasatospora sp. NPDC059973]|uniref:ATP-binding protein n=1 Tax=Kitasatospora sp. NPDC059973 TaxID=3347020 RepID=UPI00368F5745